MKLKLSKTPKSEDATTKTKKESRSKKKPKPKKEPRSKKDPRPKKESKSKKEPRRKNKLLLLLVMLILLIILAGIGVQRFVLKDKASDSKPAQKSQSEQQRDAGKAGKKESKPAPLDPSVENHLGTDFLKTLNSQHYLIRYKTTTIYNGQSFEMETAYAVSGSSIALSSADRSTIVKDGKVYMLNHTEKTILSWAVGHSDGDPKRLDLNGLVYSGTSRENGLTCESYQTASSYLKLYFKDQTLVKMITVMNGMDTVMDISQVEKKAPLEMFDIPQGYQLSEL